MNQAELVSRTLQILGALAQGQEASAVDKKTVSGVIQREHARLASEHASITWTVDDIPDAAGESYAHLIAALLTTTYKTSAEKRRELMAIAPNAEAQIKAYAANGWDREPVQSEYF